MVIFYWYWTQKINNKKQSFHDDRLLADTAIIDSSFIYNTPEKILNNSFIDALAQCSEGYDSKLANSYTRFLCERAFYYLENENENNEYENNENENNENEKNENENNENEDGNDENENDEIHELYKCNKCKKEFYCDTCEAEYLTRLKYRTHSYSGQFGVDFNSRVLETFHTCNDCFANIDRSNAQITIRKIPDGYYTIF